jgi:hypothetical protein
MATIYDGPQGKIRNWKGKRELDTYTLEDSFEKLINKPEEDNDDGREYVKFLKEAAGLQQGSNGGAGAGSDEDDDDQNTKPSDNEDENDQNLNDNVEEGNENENENENEEGEEGKDDEEDEENEENTNAPKATNESFRRLKKNIYGKTKINLSEEEILRAEKALSEALLELEEDEVSSGNVSSDVPQYEGGKEDEEGEEGNAVEESFFFDEDDEVDIKVKHPGILEVPEGKKVDELPFSHFAALVKEHGYDEISKALTNLEVWNREREPELADWAKDMRERLKAKFDTKAESYSSRRSRFFLEDDMENPEGRQDEYEEVFSTSANELSDVHEESFLFEDMLFEGDDQSVPSSSDDTIDDNDNTDQVNESFLFEDMLFEGDDEELKDESFLFEDEDLEDKEEDEEDGAIKRTIDKLEKDRKDESFLFEDMLFEGNDEGLDKDDLFSTPADELSDVHDESFLFEDEDLEDKEEDEEDGAVERDIDKLEKDRDDEDLDSGEEVEEDEEDEEDGAIKRMIDKMEDNRKSESFWYSSKKKKVIFS